MFTINWCLLSKNFVYLQEERNERFHLAEDPISLRLFLLYAGNLVLFLCLKHFLMCFNIAVP